MITHIVSLISAAFFMAVGGKNFLMARRELLPLMLCADAWNTTKDPWCFTMLSSIAFLSLGYGLKSPIRHIFGDCFGRGVWGLLVAIALSLWAFLTGHIGLPLFLAYLVVGFFAEPLFKNLKQFFGDMLIGACFSVIVFLIH